MDEEGPEIDIIFEGLLSGNIQEEEQENVSQFIVRENRRLDRLIQNLYLKFQLDHYSDRDLFDHICQAVAVYFQADCAELYLIRYEEANGFPEGGGGDPESGGESTPESRASGEESATASKSPVLKKWLELVGAFGPWRRALHPKYRRERSRTRYEIPFRQPDEKKLWRGGSTWKGYFTNSGALCCNSGYAIRELRGEDGEEEGKKPESDVKRNVVWYHDGLYNSSRCLLAAPLIREDPEMKGETKLASRIGLLKIENRAPGHIRSFQEAVGEDFNHGSLFLRELWKIAALRPYFEDLVEQKDNDGEKFKKNPELLFLPITNNVGWKQYFEDHPLGRDHFEQLLKELSRMQRKWRSPSPDQVKSVLSRYEHWKEILKALIECLIRAEGWLQHLHSSLAILSGVGEESDLRYPIPSLFNLCNIKAAASHQSSGSGSSDGNPEPGSAEEEARFARLFRGRLLAACRSMVEAMKELDADDDSSGKRIEKLRKLIAKVEDPKVGDKAEQAERIRDLCQGFANLMVSWILEELKVRNERIAWYIESGPGTSEEKDFETWKKRVFSAIHRIMNVVMAHLLWSEEELLGGFKESFQDGNVPKERIRLRHEIKEGRRICEHVGGLGSAGTTMEEAGARMEGRLDIEAVTENAGKRLAEALSVATDFSDTFSEADQFRLTFIARHVTQVLDNHLLHHARQRGVDLDYETLTNFGIDRFGISLLERIQNSIDVLSKSLDYRLRMAAARRGLRGARNEFKSSLQFNLNELERFDQHYQFFKVISISLKDDEQTETASERGRGQAGEPCADSIVGEVFSHLHEGWNLKDENDSFPSSYSHPSNEEETLLFRNAAENGSGSKQPEAKLRLYHWDGTLEISILLKEDTLKNHRDLRAVAQASELLEAFREILAR